MKRSWTPAERAWSIGVALALALGVAGAPARAAGQCQLEIKFSPADSTTTPDYKQVLGAWVRSSVVVNAQPSKPNDGIYQWTQFSGPSGVLSNANTPQPTFTAPDVGAGGAQVVLRLTLTGCDSSATKDFTINVTDAHSIVANNPPTAYAAATPASATEGTMVSLDSAGSYDPDNNALSYSWVQTGGTPVVLANAASAVATFLAPNLASTQTLRFQLTVSDGSLSRSAEALFNAVWTNDPPVARISCPDPFTVDEGQSVTLNGGASTDSDDGIASYLWEQTVGLPVAPVPTGVVWNTAAVTFNAPSLGYSQTGLVPFRFTVTDASGASASQVCSIIIRDITAPTIAGVHDILAEATSPTGAVVGFGISAFDEVDGDLTGLLACTPPAGAFAFGTTDVGCSVQDSAENPAERELQGHGGRQHRAGDQRAPLGGRGSHGPRRRRGHVRRNDHRRGRRRRAGGLCRALGQSVPGRRLDRHLHGRRFAPQPGDARDDRDPRARHAGAGHRRREWRPGRGSNLGQRCSRQLRPADRHRRGRRQRAGKLQPGFGRRLPHRRNHGGLLGGGRSRQPGGGLVQGDGARHAATGDVGHGRHREGSHLAQRRRCDIHGSGRGGRG